MWSRDPPYTIRLDWLRRRRKRRREGGRFLSGPRAARAEGIFPHIGSKLVAIAMTVLELCYRFCFRYVIFDFSITSKR
jgi:hypothetical protein